MEEPGFIRAAWIVKDNGRRARVYEMPVHGRKQLASDEVRWTAVTCGVQSVLKLA